MAVLPINRPITTSQATILVDAGLPPGKHRFRLEVIDSAGLRSAPAEVVVTITERIAVRPEIRLDDSVLVGTPIRPGTDLTLNPR